MLFVVVTVCLVAALAINHLVHGLGCWGLQPGGSTSAFIYELLMLTALLALGWLLLGLVRRRMPFKPFRLAAAAGFVAATVIMFFATGWTAFTSIHHQGPENLLAIFPLVLATLAIGTYGWPLRISIRQNTRHQSLTSVDRNETGNPYQPPQT